MTLLVAALLTVAGGYVAWRLSAAIRDIGPATPRFRRLIPALVILSFFLLPITGMVDYMLTDEFRMLQYPKGVTYWFWFGVLFLAQAIGWLILLDLIRLAVRTGSGDRDRINRFFAVATAAVVGIAVLWTGYRVWTDTTRIEITEYSHRTENRLSPLQGLRVVHISDLQGDEFTGVERMERYVEQINRLKPHLVIFTGDLISYGVDFIGPSAEVMGSIQAPLGVYAVVGDHDYWAGLDHVAPALERNGITLLRDETVQLFFDGGEIALTGITHVYSQPSDPEVVRPLLERGSAADLSLVAAHQAPEYLVKLSSEYAYDWLLAGHTHGGQLHIPVLLWGVSASELETDFVKGYYRRGDLNISVNSGLGFTLAPLRYGAPAEITLITVE